MQIFVRDLEGQTLALDVSSQDSIQAIKAQIADREEISIEEMRLVYAGRQVEDCQTLEECDISGEATLHLNLCLVGGGKKRKKKTFTKPKKIAHKKKKVKLHVLQFYRVDENGKVTRLRRECSNKECGAGTFMAKHQNREYCGRCGLTLFPKQQA